MISIARRILGESDEADKLSQAAAIYVTPEVINQGRKGQDAGCKCGKCAFFQEDTSSCILTEPAKCSAKHGVCGLFLGAPTKGGIESKPLKLITKEAAGYIEDASVPTCCEKCGYFRRWGDDEPDCLKVQGPIFEDGCCSLFETIAEEREEQEKER